MEVTRQVVTYCSNCGKRESFTIPPTTSTETFLGSRVGLMIDESTNESSIFSFDGEYVSENQWFELTPNDLFSGANVFVCQRTRYCDECEIRFIND